MLINPVKLWGNYFSFYTLPKQTPILDIHENINSIKYTLFSDVFGTGLTK